MAAAGMAFKSTPVEPRPTELLTLTSALVCRLFPLMSTRSWSGPRLRSVAGRTESVPSVIVGRGKLKEGVSACRIWLVSVVPVALWICSSEKTSTGTAFSAAAPATREPTVTVSKTLKPRAKSRVIAPPVRPIETVCGGEPGAVTVISTVWPRGVSSGTGRT